MPDLTNTSGWQCATFRNFSTVVRGKKGSAYKVFFDNTNHQGGSHFDWSCACPSYRYQRGVSKQGYCKHIGRVIAQGSRCGWSSHQSSADVRLSEGGTKASCPMCGGPVEPSSVAG